MQLRKYGWIVLLLLACAIGGWFAFDRGLLFEHRGPDVSSDMPQNEFERRGRDYLLDHPEVIMEAVSRFEARPRTEEESARQQILKDRAEEIFRGPDSPVLANRDGHATPV